MSRQLVREMRRAVAAGSRLDATAGARELAKASALALLARSVQLGHERLAVLRLAMAVEAGAEIPPAHWVYCREAASLCRDASLQALFVKAARAASAQPVVAVVNSH